MKTLKAVVFDLCGTLVDVRDYDIAVSVNDAYSQELEDKYGVWRISALSRIIRSQQAAEDEEPGRTRSDIFWENMSREFGCPIDRMRREAEEFFAYRAGEICSSANAKPDDIIGIGFREMKEAGLKLAVAADPVLPEPVIKKLLEIAGIAPNDIRFVTTMKNSAAGKPQPEFFTEICRRLDVLPEECIYVGDDPEKDAAAAGTGMETFLLTHRLPPERQRLDYGCYRAGRRSFVLFLRHTLQGIGRDKGMKTVRLYTDGACSGNPGPGGWGAILKYMDKTRELSGGEENTTNNRMELTAVIKGLQALKEPCIVELYSDSKYVIDALEKGWASKWRANNWIKPDKSPALNPDLWHTLLELTKTHELKYFWVKGHAGHPENERCDEMAVAESRKFINK